MNAFTFRMPAGIPGDINRVGTATVEAGIITPSGTTGAPLAYGVPLQVDTTTGNVGNMRTVNVSDTMIYGVLARPFPTGGSQDGLGTSTPPTSGTCDVLKRGYMTVLLSGGSSAAVKGGQAYVWGAATSGSHVQGGWEATSSSGATITVTGAYFMGPADSAGNTEIGFNI